MALAATMEQGFGHNQSLCHGGLGNLETLLVATQILNAPEHYEALNRLTALILDGMQSSG